MGFEEYQREAEPLYEYEDVVVLLKPGATELRSWLQEVLADHQLEVVDTKEISFDKEAIRAFYPHAEPQYLPGMVEHFSREPVVAVHVRGLDALRACSEIKQEVRAILEVKPPADAIHASDSIEEAKRELEVTGF
ncbi:MAG: nucleoside-diphosphate kinase [bacterium]